MDSFIHIDLFSGIGGFAIAVDEVWGKENVEHIFCENDKFCQAVLKKHWPNSKIYENIKTFTNANDRRQAKQKQQATRDKQYNRNVANTKSGKSGEQTERQRWKDIGGRSSQIDLLTGGFPCQPFSQAGVRKGRSDDRYLWPEMLRVISEFKPKVVIAENVRGLLSIENGMVFEQVCSDLEREGYEIRAFNIPACAVGAPHQRQRIWIVGYSERTGQQSSVKRQGKVKYGGAGAGLSQSDITNPNNTRSGTSASEIIQDRPENSQERQHSQSRVGGQDNVKNSDRDRKSTRLNSSHTDISRMPSSA